jgi:hypothetical protein
MRHVFHTDGDPPRSGKASLLNNSSSQNRRKELASAATAKMRMMFGDCSQGSFGV